MENVLMKVCRERQALTKQQVAGALHITPRQYNDLETSRSAMTPEQAKNLEKLFKVKAHYILESSRQLELLSTRQAIIEKQRDKLKEVNGSLDCGL